MCTNEKKAKYCAPESISIALRLEGMLCSSFTNESFIGDAHTYGLEEDNRGWF